MPYDEWIALGSRAFHYFLRMGSSPQLSTPQTAWYWWKNAAAVEGRFRATCRMAGMLWEFVRDSTPERLRARYGDADYDWDHHVNTTSGAVGWRDRLLGVFHSAYQPTEPAAFHEMLDTLQRETHLEWRDFTFIDLGSGKGRTLLMASDYPFRRIIGVELLLSLHQIAKENLGKYKSDSQKCFVLESICADATRFTVPAEPLVLFLFNPFPREGLKQVLGNLERSLDTYHRPIFVLYHNPLEESVFAEGRFKKRLGTIQYALWSN